MIVAQQLEVPPGVRAFAHSGEFVKALLVNAVNGGGYRACFGGDGTFWGLVAGSIWPEGCYALPLVTVEDLAAPSDWVENARADFFLDNFLEGEGP